MGQKSSYNQNLFEGIGQDFFYSEIHFRSLIQLFQDVLTRVAALLRYLTILNDIRWLQNYDSESREIKSQ